MTWSSANPSMLEVVGSTARGVELGQVRVTASFAGFTAEAYVQVTSAQRIGLTVQADLDSLAKQTRTSARAIAAYSDGSTFDVTQLADWSSDVGLVAQVSNDEGARGVVRALAAGTATVVATYDGFSAWTAIDVREATLSVLRLEQPRASLPKGVQMQLQVIGEFTDGSEQELTADADWSSDAPTVLEAYNGQGRSGQVWAREVGSSQVSASALGQRVNAVLVVEPPELASLEVRAARVVVPKGLSEPLRLMGHFSDGSERDLTSSATWSSSDPALAAVSNTNGTKGELRAYQSGQVVVRAEVGSASATLVAAVGPAKLMQLALRADAIDLERPVLPLGNKLVFSVHGVFSDGLTEDLTELVTLTSSDEAVLALTSAHAVLGVAEGTATVTATLKELEVRVDITVAP
jgi:uncharacterized protein YjdB